MVEGTSGYMGGTSGYMVGCWKIVSISLLSEKEGKGEGIERSFERWREHEEREERGREERRREIVEERDCDNIDLKILVRHKPLTCLR